LMRERLVAQAGAMQMRMGAATTCVVIAVMSLSACGGARRPTGADSTSTTRSPRASSGAPLETPGRTEVVNAMSQVSGAVAACGGDQRDELRVAMVFESSGAMIEASVDAEYSWGSAEPGPGCVAEGASYSCTRTRAPQPELDACVVRAVRSARVPPFTRPRFLVRFPFHVGR
jgi:hypothetical protein